jgi:hypothetical protein
LSAAIPSTPKLPADIKASPHPPKESPQVALKTTGGERDVMRLDTGMTIVVMADRASHLARMERHKSTAHIAKGKRHIIRQEDIIPRAMQHQLSETRLIT